MSTGVVRGRGLDLPALLRRARVCSPVEAVDAVVDEVRRMIGATEVRLLVTDVTRRAMVVYAGTEANAARVRADGGRPEMFPLPGSDHEQVLRSCLPSFADERRPLFPVADRGDVLGVLETRLPREVDDTDRTDLALVADLLAQLLVSCRRHSDLEDWAQAGAPFSLAAEIQRRLLPGSYSCDATTFSVAGWLEPANAVGGDTFDYCLERGTLHFSITDAVGHDVNAALLASVLMGSLRNSRRRGVDLAEQARRANEAMAAHSPSGQFVTGQVARLDLGTGVVELVNAGHPWPLRVRDGEVTEIKLDIDMPFGVDTGRSFQVQRIELQPGDRLLLVTDGMLERNAERIDLPVLLHDSARAHPREVVYLLAEMVLHHTGGELRDDATVVCLDWHGPAR